MSTMITLTNGGFQDPAGNLATGTLVLTLTQNAVTNDASPNNQVLSQGYSVRVPIVNGAVVETVKIWSNAELTPATGYRAQFQGTNYTVDYGVWVFSQLGGATVDLGTMVPASVSASYAGAVLLTPSGTQAITSFGLQVPSVTVGTVNNTVTVDGVHYTTIQSALNALGSNGGTVVCPVGYRETITAPITLGDNTAKAVILRLMNDVKLTIDITNNTQSAFVLGEGSGIVGSTLGAANRNGGSLIQLAATCNIANVITTGTDDPQAFVTLERFYIDNGLGGAVGGAFLNLVNLNNASCVRDLFMAYPPHIGINIASATGGTVGPLVIDNCYVYGGLTNSRPLVIQSNNNASIVGVTVLGGYYNGCGTNLANIEINGNGNTTSVLRDITLLGCYLEQESPATTTTGIKIADAAGVTIIGCEFSLTTATTGHTGILISQSGSGRTHSIVVINFRLSGAGTQAGLTNSITSDGPYITATGSIPFYGYQGTSGTEAPGAFVLGTDTTLDAGDNCYVGVNLGTYNLTVGGEIGFYGHALAAKPTVTGSKGGNAALASLLTALAGLGLLTDSST